MDSLSGGYTRGCVLISGRIKVVIEGWRRGEGDNNGSYEVLGYGKDIAV